MSIDARQRLSMLSPEQKRVLAARVTQRRPAGATPSIPRRHDDAAPVPLSYAQQRFWFLCQLDEGNGAYTVGDYHCLTGALDISALERGLNEIVRRHSVLRTSFAVHNGVPVQTIAPALRISLPVDDLSHLPPAEREATLRRVASDEVRRPWSLESGPLVRARLWRLDADRHQLLVLMHHIVSDGWSQGVLTRELAALYDAFANGRPSPLRPLPIDYADYAVWQHTWMRTPQYEQQLAYWRGSLKDLPVLQLPKLGKGSRTGIHRWFRLNAELSRQVRELAQRESATVYMVLLAAFASLLARYSGQADVVVGSPIANRDRPEFEPLIGSFMNPLPIRADLGGDPTFTELIRRVRGSALGAFANQNVPFDVLVRTLHPRRDVSHPPLFQAMFLMQNVGLQSLQLSGNALAATSYAALNDVALPDDVERPGPLMYPLALQILEIGAVLGGTIEYGQEHAAFMGRFPDHLRTFLAAAVAHPETRLSALPLLTAQERTQVLAQWNHDASPLVAECAHRLFELEAAAHPDRPAVTAGSSTLTYRELNTRANAIARQLRAHGVGPEVRVGILSDRSVDMVASVLAVMKAGGAYVPLDAAYPADRLRHIVRDSGLRVLLAAEAVADRVGDLTDRDARSFSVLRLDAVPAADTGANVDGGVTAAHLAYVIYTSGSTGVPKGTMVTHGSLANAFQQWERAYDLRNVGAHLQMASLSFDVCTGDIVRALCSGAALVIAPQEDLFSPAALCSLMRKHRVEAAEFVPVVLRDLVKYVEQNDVTLPHLKLLVAGSDSWFTSEYVSISALFGGNCRVINSYGLTEATIDSTYFDGPAHLAGDDDGMVPLGRAFANTELLILDRNLQLVPVGIPGELCVAGPALARGYLGRADLTAERFVPHPFSEQPGARLYRSGDLARYRPDGTLELLGRIDNQIKLRGFRIELAEIESVLRLQEGVIAAAAIVREDQPGDRRLVAYIVAAHAGVTPSVLRASLRATLPDYMVPSAIVTLAALPLTPNGKIDRAALPKPDGARQIDQTFVSPQTALERQLAAIWCEVLQVDQVGVTDNFFDLGGHSLLLIQLHARIVAALQVKLTVLDLFRFPTIATLAGHLSSDSPEPQRATGALDRADRRRAASRLRKGRAANVLRGTA